MSDILNELLSWQSADGDQYLERGAASAILYMTERRFQEYEPDALVPFLNRLEKWLNNFNNAKERKTAVSALANLFFVGRNEFDALYRTAYGLISEWTVDQYGLDITSPQLSQIVENKVANCWICPITDSLRINGFLKINNIVGKKYRPDWRSLKKFSAPEAVQKFMDEECISDVVLLEDFVGSGSQIADTLEFGLSKFPNTNFLVCPLIICPTGHDTLSKLAQRYDRLEYKSAMQISDTALLNKTATAGEPNYQKNLRTILQTHKSRFSCGGSQMLGYRDTGGILAMYSNCPDNTVPIFRDENPNWEPLFPRIWRLDS